MKRVAACVVIAVLGLAGCGGSSGSNPPATNASTPPAPIPNGEQAAPANLAATLLRPGDLGSTWRAVETPAAGIRTPPPFAVGPAPAYEIHTNLETAHWTGSTWTTDQTVQETATNYGTPGKASQELSLQVLQGRGKYKSFRVSGLSVWRLDSHQPGTNVFALFAVGQDYVRLTVSVPTSGATGVVSTATVLRRAIQRLRTQPTV